MNRSIRIALPLLALTLVLGASTMWASQEIAQDTNLKCTQCHDKAGSKLLTDKGKYYETMGSLDGFDKLSTEFGRCTQCHVRKPGSPKLTKEGKRLAEVVNDMAELRKWLEERHPQPAAK